MSEPPLPADPATPAISATTPVEPATPVDFAGGGVATPPPSTLAALEARPWFGAWLWLALAIVALLVNGRALSAPSFLWTDRALVGENTFLNSLGGVQRIWAGIFHPSEIRLTQYAPLAQTTLYFDRLIWGNFAGGARVTSCLLHATCGLMAWYLLRRLGIRVAIAVAILFVLHPTSVETVSMLSERRTILATLCGLAGTFLLLRAMRVIEPVPGAKPMLPEAPDRLYLLAAALFVVGFFAHGMICLLPAAALLVAWWRRRPIDAIAVGVSVGLMVAGAAMLGLNARVAHERVPTDPSIWQRADSAGADLAVRTEIAGRAVAFYVAKLVFPYPLMSDYPRWTTPRDVAARLAHQTTEDLNKRRTATPDISAASAADWAWPIAVAAVLAGLAVASPRIGRGPIACAGCLALCLLPVVGFVDLDWMSNGFVADRAVYLASVPLLAGLCALLAPWLARPGQESTAGWTLGLIALAFAAIGTSLSGRYKDPASFWFAAIDRKVGNPRSTAALMNIAEGLMQLSPPDVGKARDALERARVLRPNDPNVYLTTGDVEFAAGDVKKAIAAYTYVAERFPNDARGPYRLATVYRGAADLKPTDPQLRARARAYYARAVEIDGSDADALAWFGVTNYEFLARLPDNSPEIPELVDRTAVAFDRAVQLDPYDPDRLVLISKYLIAMGQLKTAGSLLRTALQFDQQNPDIFEQIAEAALKNKDFVGAESAMQVVIKLDDSRANALLKLGSLYRASGRFEEAKPLLERAVALDPENAEAKRQLALVLAGDTGTTRPTTAAATTIPAPAAAGE